MIDPELKEWISLIKDIVLALAALVTMIVGVYGVRAWKRDLIAKEVYPAAKNLVKESHLVARASRKLREPVQAFEKKQFTEEEIQHTTQNERWRISEAEVYKSRIEAFAQAVSTYHTAQLELRVLIGSKTYEGFLPFSAHLTESINRVNEYLELLQDHYRAHLPNSPEIIAAQNNLYPSENLDDELTQKVGDTREEGEKTLLSYLHRKNIYG